MGPRPVVHTVKASRGLTAEERIDMDAQFAVSVDASVICRQIMLVLRARVNGSAVSVLKQSSADLGELCHGIAQCVSVGEKSTARFGLHLPTPDDFKNAFKFALDEPKGFEMLLEVDRFEETRDWENAA